MIKSFDEYKRMYEENPRIEGLEFCFELWLTFSWLKDRFPSFKNPSKNSQNHLHRIKYLKQALLKRLHEVYKNDHEFGEVLYKGLTLTCALFEVMLEEELEKLAELSHR